MDGFRSVFHFLIISDDFSIALCIDGRSYFSGRCDGRGRGERSGCRLKMKKSSTEAAIARAPHEVREQRLGGANPRTEGIEFEH